MARSEVRDLAVQAGAGTDAATHARRYRSAASRTATKKPGQPGREAQATGWNATARGLGRLGSVNPARREPPHPFIVVLCIGLTAEAVLPWSVIWLSDTFLFDIPGWSLWLIFGAPAALTVLAVLTCRATQIMCTSRARSLGLGPVRITTRS
jgi:hypothetical protein